MIRTAIMIDVKKRGRVELNSSDEVVRSGFLEREHGRRHFMLETVELAQPYHACDAPQMSVRKRGTRPENARSSIRPDPTGTADGVLGN
jgi:hypothetical protein